MQTINCKTMADATIDLSKGIWGDWLISYLFSEFTLYMRFFILRWLLVWCRNILGGSIHFAEIWVLAGFHHCVQMKKLSLCKINILDKNRKKSPAVSRIFKFIFFLFLSFPLFLSAKKEIEVIRREVLNCKCLIF